MNKESIKCGDILVAVKEDLMASSSIENFISAPIWDFTFEKGDVFFVIGDGMEHISISYAYSTVYPVDYCVLLTRFGIVYADICKFGDAWEVVHHSP